MTIPSKELLSAVLGVKVEYIRLIDIYDGRLDARANDLHITFEEYVENINIYEIAHKCKEWAWRNDRVLYSSYKGHCYISNLNANNPDNEIDHYALTEHEAIFKACEWILKETK